MSFLKALCCRSTKAPSADPASKPTPSNGTQHLNEKQYQDPEIAKLPTKPSEFVKHLEKHHKTSTRELLQPYLQYELWLRKAFAQGDVSPDGKANLVPVLDKGQPQLHIRNFDRGKHESQKFLMPLPDKIQETWPEGSPATAGNLDKFTTNFDAFTHGVLRGLDWSNIVAAGSSALLPLLPYREDVKVRFDPVVEATLETYYQRTASSSDIDLFLYGLDEEAAIQRIKEIEAVIRRNQRLDKGTGLTLRTENAITFVSPRWPFRHVQIILRLYKSVSEILTGFDVDCACVAFDGHQVYSNPRGILALATRTNIIDLSRRSPSYENRLYKYRSHLFDAYWDQLDRSKVSLAACSRTSKSPNVEGLARLIFFESLFRKYADSYKRRRNLRTIDENGEPTPSGYATLEVPYGERFTATKVRKFVSLHSKEPYAFGTVDEVLSGETKAGKRGQGKLDKRLSFIKDDPGRQMIGSFHPLSEDDWTAMAYGDACEDNDSSSGQ